MAIEITIPRLGWSMEEGIFGEWLKRDGDYVKAGDALFTLESEKALQEIESVDEGVLKILSGGPAEGETVKVGTLIAHLVRDGEAAPVLSSSGAQSPSRSDGASNDSWSAAHLSPASDLDSLVMSVPPPETAFGQQGTSKGFPAISPRAARLARELGIDWQHLQGTGRKGRIRERDVRSAVGSPQTRPAAKGRTRNAVRTVIAERMLQSAQSTAPVTLTMRADATNLVSLRRQFQSAGGDAVVPAYHDIVLKIVAAALSKHPVMASRWSDGAIIPAGSIDIGIAVDTEAGLLVPVVRGADRLSLRDVALQSREIIARALARKCTKGDLEGAVFTVSNLGPFGIETFTPIINLPEAAILGLGAIRREPVVRDGDQIVACDLLPLSLTFDHRVTDGAPAARFLRDVRLGLENPSAWLIE